MAEKNIPDDPRIGQLQDNVKELQEMIRHAVHEHTGTVWNNRNWEAVKQTLEGHEKRFRTFEVQIESVKNLVMGLQSQFQAFQQQRAIELQKMVNYAATQRDEENSS